MTEETHNITWLGISIEIIYIPEKFGLVDHIEVKAEGRAPLPITETGYKSHFMPAGSVAEYGGAVAFVTSWLEHEAKRSGWSGAQLSLF